MSKFIPKEFKSQVIYQGETAPDEIQDFNLYIADTANLCDERKFMDYMVSGDLPFLVLLEKGFEDKWYIRSALLVGDYDGGGPIEVFHSEMLTELLLVELAILDEDKCHIERVDTREYEAYSYGDGKSLLIYHNECKHSYGK